MLDKMRMIARVSMQSIADFMYKDMLAELGGCDTDMIDRAYSTALPLVLRGNATGLNKKYLASLDTRPYWESIEWWESSPPDGDLVL